LFPSFNVLVHYLKFDVLEYFFPRFFLSVSAILQDSRFLQKPVYPIKNSPTLPNCRMISKSKEFKAVGRSHRASKNCHLKTQEPVFFELNYFPFFVITMCFTNHSDREITVSLTSPVGWSAVPPQSVTWLAGCCASSGGC